MDNLVSKRHLNITKENKNLPSSQYILKTMKQVKKLMFLEKLVYGDLKELTSDYRENKPFKNKNIRELMKLLTYSSIVEDSTQIVVSEQISENILSLFTVNYKGTEKNDVAKSIQEISKGDIFKADFKDWANSIMLQVKDDEYYNTLFLICRRTYGDQELIKYTTFREEFTDGEIAFYVIKNKIPRVFVDCPYLDECEKANIINVSVINKKCCMKTARTLHNCKTIGSSGTFVTFCFFVLIMTSTVSELLNSRKTYTKVETDKGTDTTKDNTKDTNNKKVQYKSDFITVYTSESTNFEKHYKVKSSTGTGTIKAEHIRREHTRTLKSGKVIPVRQSTINKGKGKKPYYLK